MGCPCNNSNRGCKNWSNFCIGELWLFSGLKQEELIAVGQRAIRSNFEPGQTVFLQGDRAQSIFLIKTGRIRLSRVMENGTEIILDIRKPGDYLGEYILNDLNSEFHYPVSAWCVDKVVTCSFNRKVFEEILLEFPSIGLMVVKNMAGRIANLTERIEAMSQVHLEEKIYGVLLNVAREHGHKRDNGRYVLEMPLTHEDLGFLVGAHRVSVTRVMKRLKETGRVISDGKSLIVLGQDMFEDFKH
jgi:CRP/FNR family transcriptional regulator